MQFGLSLPNFSRLATREAMIELAQEAEALGFDAIWTTDHVMMARGQEDPYGTVLEALMTLAYVAPLTSRVRLGVSVIVLPQRQPVLVAKQVATLDVLSQGRVIVGVGTGWNEREFAYLGTDFHTRGKRMNESMQALRELWTAPDPRFEGTHVSFSDVLFAPRPVQPGGPPIWVGGSSPAALRRVAQLADGWQPIGPSPEEIAAGLNRIREMAGGRQITGSVRIRAAVGRDLPAARSRTGQPQSALSGAPDQIVERLRAYEQAGVEHVLLQFPVEDVSAYLQQMRQFSAEVRPRYLAAAGVTRSQ